MFVRNDNNARLNDLLAPQDVASVRARYSDNSVTKTVSRFFLGCAAISGIAFLLSASPIALVSCGTSLGLSLFFSALDSRMRRYRYRQDPSVVIVDNRRPANDFGTNALLRETARLEAEAEQRRLNAAVQANLRLQQEAAERERALAAAQAQRRRDEAALAATLHVAGTNTFSRHMPESSQSAARLEADRARALAAAEAQRQRDEAAAAARARASASHALARHMPESANASNSSGSRQKRHETDTQQAARHAAAPRPSAPPQTFTRHMPESQQQPQANPPANQYKRHMPDSAKK